MRPRDAAWQLDHQCQQRAGADHRRSPAGRLRLVQAGLIGLTRDVAQQWTGRRGIRVNAIAPGYFASEMTDQFDTEYFDSTILPRTLRGRLGEPEELSAALLFLASDASSYITGITLLVEGGMLTT